jgi:GTP cyclohydrolase I
MTEWDYYNLMDARAALVLATDGELNPERNDHHRDTPKRWLNMMREMTTPQEFEFTTFRAESDEMVVVKDIQFYSLCSHHLVPFFGVAHIGYVPDQLIVGLSKLPRTVVETSKGLWAQENLTRTIALNLQDKLQPLGVAVVMEARHLCMEMRGVKAPGTYTTTSSMQGVFADHTRLARSEFFSLVHGGK